VQGCAGVLRGRIIVIKKTCVYNRKMEVLIGKPKENVGFNGKTIGKWRF